MSPDWRFEVVDRMLRIDLTGGIEAPDFERLYDDILRDISSAEGVLIDLGADALTGTADFLLDSLVANLRARDIPTVVLRRPPDPAEPA